MKKEINILIVDKRPMFIEGIKSSLRSNQLLNGSLCIEESNDYESAVGTIQAYATSSKYFDIIITDIELNQDRVNCLDLNERLMANFKRMSPSSKIIIVLQNKDNFRIYNIVKRIKPSGFLVETELNKSRLQELINSVLKEAIYYSNSIFSTINIMQKNATHLDEIDREILYLLSKGVKTKNLTKYITRSLSALEKRKQRIKDILILDNCTDDELLKEASLLQIV